MKQARESGTSKKGDSGGPPSGRKKSLRSQGLGRYKEKRDFQRTPEPAGRVHAGEGYSFVIQKHHATHLHYDFRLELGGVLKSWAVPKGPSLDPSVKRFAAHVEDHPIEYGGFEGVIPQGQYGGGTVIVWDRGTWVPVGDPEAGYRKGHLKFRLEGEKLRGGWTLIRMRARGNEPEDKNWLLIKEKDEYAASGEITQEKPGSVLSGGGPPRVWESNRPTDPPSRRAKEPRRPKAKGSRDPMPELLEPELTTLVARPPEGDEWIHEIKFDGYRVVCRIEGPEVHLTTRHGKDWTESFPTLVRAARQLQVKEALIDGELVILDPSGVSSFQALQNALGKGREKDILYYAFDLVYLDGRDLSDLPLLERKKELARILAKAPAMLRLSEHVEGSGLPFFQKSCELSLEGVVSKRKDSPYRSGRAGDWLKAKCLGRQEFVIAGYTDPEGSRSGFGALVLGVHEKDGRLRYAGRVGTGFSEETLIELGRRLEAGKRSASPFDQALVGRSAKGVHWVEPNIVAEVAFSGWTKDGVLRHPSFQGLREDKVDAEVVQERPEAPAPAAPRQDLAGVTITHPERLLYPEEGITKQDLADYYSSISDWILPHLVGRPLSIVRCPQGQGKPCFYQKHANEGTPEVLRRVRIPEGAGTVKGMGTYLTIDGLPGLLALVQMAALELHPWGSRVDSLERPDRMTIDLDPGPGVPWDRMIETALALRSKLGDHGLQSFVKTTGGKGLHVVVPLEPRQSWNEIKEFSRELSEEFVRAAPQWFVSTMTKSKREGKIFLDFFRNSRGATAVAPYSTRARAGAPVSTPLSWDELSTVKGGDAFRVKDVPGRVRDLRVDPWKGFFDLRQSLTGKPRQRKIAPKRRSE